MVIFIILHLCCAIENTPIILDSTIYSIDVENSEVTQLTLHENVIDYVSEDFLYLLTSRHLYKIDMNNLLILDNVPLPFRFNDLGIMNGDVILISMNEIVSLDKMHLSFKRGIGIERGDYRHITLPQSMTPSGENHYVLLITDTERESIFKIFDLKNGRLIKKMAVPKVLVVAYNAVDNTLASLDINNNLIVYDVQLNKKKVIHPDIKSNSFTHCGDGYLMSNREGIFLLNSNGNVIDFQPLALDEHYCADKYLFFVKNGIVYVDSLTLRIKKRNQVNKELIKLFHIDSMNNFIALDTDDNFYLLEDGFSWLRPMQKREAVLKKIELPVSSIDSLWYFQVGAFENQGHALALYDSLRQNNIPVFIDTSDLYRIKFGGFKDKMNAMKLITEMRLHGWFIFQQKMRLGKREEFYVGTQKYILEEGVIQRSNHEKNN